MKLKGKQAFGPTGLFVIVNQFRGFDSVDVLSEMKAFGGNAVLVPLSLFHRFSDFSRIPEFLSFLLQFSLFVQGQGGLVSAHRKNAPKGLAVANSRKTVSGFEIGLIPTDPPTVLLAGFEKTAVLNAAVPAFDLVFQGQVKVLEGSVLPNEESVSLGWIFLGVFSENRTVFDPPVIGVAVPSVEAFAVKEASAGVSG